MNKKKDIYLSLLLTVFIISFAVVVTVFFKPLYYYDITALNIEAMSHRTIEVIKENYDILINYQSIFFTGPLLFKDFVMSTSGKIHFEEVKVIFCVLQVAMVVSGILSIPMIIKNFKNHDYHFLKLTSILTIAIPSLIGLLASLDFDAAFTLFHTIVFRNNYWIFDYRIDPIITILPEDFFMHAFFMIIVLVLCLSALCFIVYRIQTKKAGLEN